MRLADTVEAVIDDWLSRSAATSGQRPFVHTRDRTYVYADLDAMADSAADRIASMGAGRVGLVARNDIQSVAALFGIWRAGASCVLINARLTEPERLAQLQTARCDSLVDQYSTETVAPAQRSLAHGDNDEALIVFTSGSGGLAKGVVLTWGNLDASQSASATHLAHNSDDIWLCVLPLFHVGGLSIVIRSAAVGGAIRLEPWSDTPEMTEALRRSTLASLVSTQLSQLLDEGDSTFDVRAVLIGGGPASQSLLDRAYERGLGVLSTYGMTETASQVATAPMGMAPQRLVQPIAEAEVALGNDGAISVRGPMVAASYLDGPAIDSDGWLATSDIGEEHPGGMRIVGRRSELIISGGENVMASEVEEALKRIDGVQDACVVGLPDDRWGEAVAAVLVMHEGDVTYVENRLRESLAGYKVPRRWVVADTIPRTALGKPRRHDVQELFE